MCSQLKGLYTIVKERYKFISVLFVLVCRCLYDVAVLHIEKL